MAKQLHKNFIGSLVKTLIERYLKLEIDYTSKHGSWLNIAEIELSALVKQCLNHYIPDKENLQSVTMGWEQKRNDGQKGVDWQFTTPEARIKLKRLDP